MPGRPRRRARQQLRDTRLELEPHRYRRPRLYPKQRDALFHLERYGCVEASTKAGKTYGCMAWLSEWAHLDGRPGRQYWWVAPWYGAAMIAKRRLEKALGIPAKRDVDGYWYIEVESGGRIVFRSGEKPATLYGEDVRAAVVDEASHLREEAWIALRTTLTATRGPVRLIGNVRGRRNWFYRMSRRAEEGRKGYRYAKLTAYDAIQAGVLSREEVEDARRTFAEAGRLGEYEELYEAKASDDGGNPFGVKAIRACILDEAEAERIALETVPVAYGVDLARSVDWVVVIGLNALGQVAVFERWQGPWGETKARIDALVGESEALVDMTGVGDSVVEDLQRGEDFSGSYEGFKFTGASKQPLMEALAREIQTQAIAIPPGLIPDELEEFTYEYTRQGVKYAPPEGMHDDCVDALALAVRKWRQTAAAGWYLGDLDDEDEEEYA